MAASEATRESPLPAAPEHVIVIYGDDVGFYDLSCYRNFADKLSARLGMEAAKGPAIVTPALDRLAQGGLLFSDAHSSAATCTPSRYSLFSGEYPFRRPGTEVLSGNANLILDPERISLAQIFKQAGYQTAIFGKWHLGLGKGAIDWNKAIVPGPKEVGFDHSWIVAATGDRVPCVMIKDGSVDKLDPADPIKVDYQKPFAGEITGKSHAGLRRMLPSQGHNDALINGIPRIGFMQGGKAALWNDETLPDEIRDRALQFIRDNKQRKFFLFLATHDIHVPRVPAARWLGKSALGVRGDMILQLDETVAKVVACLKEQGIYEQTMLVFSSDNGPMVDDGYVENSTTAAAVQSPAYPWRGGKYSVFEGGTRLPFIVSWPQRIKPGQSSALICQMDLLASFAHALDVKIPAAQARDSQNLWPALLDGSRAGREQLVLTHGKQHALRLHNWKYIPPNLQLRSSWLRADRPQFVASGAKGLLYDLERDPGEQHNLSEEHPQQAAAMQKILDETLQ